MTPNSGGASTALNLDLTPAERPNAQPRKRSPEEFDSALANAGQQATEAADLRSPEAQRTERKTNSPSRRAGATALERAGASSVHVAHLSVRVSKVAAPKHLVPDGAPHARAPLAGGATHASGVTAHLAQRHGFDAPLRGNPTEGKHGTAARLGVAESNDAPGLAAAFGGSLRASPSTPTAELATSAALPPTSQPHDVARTMLELALADPSLAIDLRPHQVLVALQTETLGALTLDVRVHDGKADVRVDGPAAPLVSDHVPELREVLSQEGLSLGNFDQRDSPRQGPESGLAPEEPRNPKPAVSVNEPTRGRRHEGRIDVEA